jgi:hypothetical protein
MLSTELLKMLSYGYLNAFREDRRLKRCWLGNGGTTRPVSPSPMRCSRFRKA